MSNPTLPAIDQNLIGVWTEGEIDQYNKLPYYLTRATAAFNGWRETWSPLLKRTKWTPNVGEIMKQVGLERTPVLRQMAFPSLLRAQPTADINYLKERTVEAKLYRHRFRTPEFGFLPSFQDFIDQKIAPYREDLNRQIMIYTEQFYRTYMYHMAPYVYVCGHGMIDAPSGVAESLTDNTNGKTPNWLSAQVLPKISKGLTFQELYACLHTAEDEIGCTPFEGSLLNNKWSAPMDGKFALIANNEVWNKFIDDPWVKENRPLNMNIITDGLRGDIFNRIRFRTECYGLRIKTDNDWAVNYPAPETSVVGGPEANRTKPLQDYSKNAGVGVAFLVGGPSYQIIQVGPAPSDFTGKDVNGIIGMDWNGKINLTRNFLVPELDANGNEVRDTNSWGEYIRMQAQVAMGIVGYNIMNVIPIFYSRSGNSKIQTVS